jgi:hypothetical protein
VLEWALFEILLVLAIGQYTEDTQMDIRTEITKRLKGVALYSQEEVSDPMVRAKLFDTGGSGTWHITEYDGEDRAFGYVTGLDTPEWGYVSLGELAAIRLRGIPRIECDLYFTPKPFSEVKV